jgi:hypothetical protein
MLAYCVVAIEGGELSGWRGVGKSARRARDDDADALYGAADRGT